MDELQWLATHGPAFGAEVLTAAVCGLLIGYERAAHGAPAGMKTCLLVCVGATIYAHIGVALHEQLPTPSQADPARVAAQIVSGIGFLGAGTILRDGPSVQGLTTAATIWLLGALGIVIGCGFPISGALLTGTMVLLIELTRRAEKHLIPRHGPPDG